MTYIKEKTMDEERALYNLCDASVEECIFAGEADGESALKEARRVDITKCRFSLRYPMWHISDFSLTESDMDETARAALWYAKNGNIENCRLNGVKLLRECGYISLSDSVINSTEFGWRCRDIEITDTALTSEYCFFESRNIKADNLEFKGKYSFQYTESVLIENSVLDTKDAFWHSHNVTVRNSVINGEYLGWYSEGLTLVDCKIKGTQPLCYCKDLTLINCTLEDADLAFEYSDVTAEIIGNIISVKNPLSGSIKADSIGDVILSQQVYPCCCEIITGKD